MVDSIPGDTNMIRISNLSLPIGKDLSDLRKKAAKRLGLRPGDLTAVTPVRQSIDARKKQDVHYVYTVDVDAPDEAALVRRAGDRNVTLHIPQPYVFPAPVRRPDLPPVVVGMGPAGLFATLFLARAGIPSIVLERGRDVDARTADVERFWSTGSLDPQIGRAHV